MSTKNQKSKSQLSPEQRGRRRQQVLFATLAIILIVSWILSLVIQH
jgi:hypothetical protein